MNIFKSTISALLVLAILAVSLSVGLDAGQFEECVRKGNERLSECRALVLSAMAVAFLSGLYSTGLPITGGIYAGLTGAFSAVVCEKMYQATLKGCEHLANKP
ncbi:MAG: hypothetical protein ACRD1R_20630 [Acidobacteriota bacterium]